MRTPIEAKKRTAKHTQEPWGIAENHLAGDSDYKYQFSILSLMTTTVCEVTRHNYREVGRNKFKNPHTLHEDKEAKANAERIVACVNSAKFVSNEWLQSNSVNALIESERESKMKVEALLHALKTIQLRYNESFLKEHQELIAKAISYATN